MKESGSHFNLRAVEEPPTRQWRSFGAQRLSSFLVGNPSEGQYLKITLTDFEERRVQFSVMEKLGEREEFVKDVWLDEYTDYQLAKDPQGSDWLSFYMGWTYRRHVGGAGFRVQFRTPPNVDIVPLSRKRTR